MSIRASVICLLGHVDSGKTSILDKIRGTAVAKKEAGGITQMIGSSYLPNETIKGICAPSIKSYKIEIKMPGLLFIDTPGHESFTNLRERGGSIADIAILVVDVMKGFQPQTEESIRILKGFKTPFMVAVNKVDLIRGWKEGKTFSFSDSFSSQQDYVKEELDEKLYSIIGRLSSFGIDSERFDRVEDFTKQVVIVPLSAKTGEGISELLLFLSGLSQRFLEKQLNTEAEGPGKGSILEVKEERGLGKTVDVILYDGIIRKNDTVVFGTSEGSAETKVRAILKPLLPSEIKDPSERYKYVDEARAAAGVKLFAPNLENALPGSPLLVARSDEEKETAKKSISEQVRGILLKSESGGVILKADTLGSAEAALRLLISNNISVREAGIGKVTKRDVIEASAVAKENRQLGAVLSFNVPVTKDAEEESEKTGVPIISSDVIYGLLDQYKERVRMEAEKEKKEALSLSFPAKVVVLRGFCFRMSKPAIFGVEVAGGKLKPHCELMTKKGDIVGKVKTVELERKAVEEATSGMQVAISVEGAVYGKDVNENDVLYTYIKKETIETLKRKLGDELTSSDIALMDEILGITKKVGF